MLTGVVFLGLVLLAVFWRPWRDFTPADAADGRSAGEWREAGTVHRVVVTAASGTFRMAILPGFIFMFALDVPLAVTIVAFLQGTTDALLSDTLVGATAGLPLSLLGSFVMSRSFKIGAGESGLKGYSVSIFQRSFAWNDIEVIGPIRILTLRYLRLRSISSGKRMWLPLFLQRPEEFRERVAGFAPGHAMLAHL